MNYFHDCANLYVNNEVNSFDVETISLDDIIQTNNIEKIKLLKIDCEGAELDIFENIKPENLNKISKMVIETHSDYINGYIRNVLTENNFEIHSKGNILFAFSSLMKK